MRQVITVGELVQKLEQLVIERRMPLSDATYEVSAMVVEFINKFRSWPLNGLFVLSDEYEFSPDGYLSFWLQFIDCLEQPLATCGTVQNNRTEWFRQARGKLIFPADLDTIRHDVWKVAMALASDKFAWKVRQRCEKILMSIEPEPTELTGSD